MPSKKRKTKANKKKKPLVDTGLSSLAMLVVRCQHQYDGKFPYFACYVDETRDGPVCYCGTNPPTEHINDCAWLPLDALSRSLSENWKYVHPCWVDISPISGKWRVSVEFVDGRHVVDLFNSFEDALKCSSNAQSVFSSVSPDKAGEPSVFMELLIKLANYNEERGIISSDEVLGVVVPA